MIATLVSAFFQGIFWEMYISISLYLFGTSVGAPMGFVMLEGVDQTDSDNCDTCDSGVARFLLIECAGIDLAGSSFDPVTGCITGLAFTDVGIAAEYVPDKDNTAKLDFLGERTGSVHNVNVDGFAKFKCLNKAKIAEGNRLKKTCCLVIVAEYNDCNIMVGGLDVVSNCSVDGELRLSKQEIQATISIIGGDGSDESRMEVVFAGQQRCFTALDQDVTTYEDLKTSLGL